MTALLWPCLLAGVTITASTRTLRFSEDGVEKSAQLSTGTYWLRGDGSSADLLKNLSDALTAAGATWVGSVQRSYDPSQPGCIVTLTASGVTTAALLWGSTHTTLDGSHLGYTQGDTSTGLTFVGDSSALACWVGDEPPQGDEAGLARRISQTVHESGEVLTTVRGASRRLRVLTFDGMAIERTRTDEGGASSYESLLRAYGDGTVFEVHLIEAADDAGGLEATNSASLLSGRRWVPELSSLEGWQPTRRDPGVPLYSWQLRLLEDV